MAFIARMLDEEQFVLLQFEGILTISALVASRKALRLLLQDTPWRKILVDLQNVSNTVRTADIHEFVSSHYKEFPANIRIAMIVDPRDWNDSIFAEVISQNRGTKMRAFQNCDQAKEWLRAG